MQLQFFGAARTVTGSCFLLTTDTAKILVDCGLFQGSKEIKERNYADFPFNPREIDYLLLTHAHIDHTGLVPKLYKKGYRGPAIATAATVDLLGALLPDSGHIQEMEIERKNRKASRAGKSLLEPIYTAQDGKDCIKHFQRVEYGAMLELTPTIRVRFIDAGHILGSSMIELYVQEKGLETKIVFSGDIGNSHQPIINDPSIIENADYVVMESTYGNRLHQIAPNDRTDELFKVIEEAFRRGGNLIIPAFAVERTQDLLYHLNLLLTAGRIPQRDVYIDSPLAIAATEIFCNHIQNFDDETKDASQNGCALYIPGLKFSRTADESQALNILKGGSIIIAGSGMCDAGRIKHHLKHNLWRAESTILFVGFQAKGTLGRRILDGEKLVRVHGEEVSVRAQIRNLDGFSAHADQKGLMDWVKGFKQKPARIFVVHGEEESSKALAGIIREDLGITATVPAYQETVTLAPSGLEAVKSLAVATAVTAEEVERAYLKLRTHLRELVEIEQDAGNYPELMDKFRRLNEMIDTLMAESKAS